MPGIMNLIFRILLIKKSLTIGGINNYVYGFDDSATHTKNVENRD